MIERIRKRVNEGDLRRFRFWVQLVSFIVFVYGGYFAMDLGSSFPIFTCPYNDKAGATCYLISLQHQLSRPTQILFSFASFSILVGFLTFAAWFILLNKGWCGFVCPIGTLQDWLTALRVKLGIRFGKYTQKEFDTLSLVKYGLLALTILFPLLMGIGALGREWSAAFCQMCPGRIISPMFRGDFSQLQIDFSSVTIMVLTSIGVLFTALFFVGSFIKKRFFCFFCPMSALHYIFSDVSILRFKKDGSKCTKCGDCYAVCDMQIKDIADDVLSINILRDDCTLCLKCVAACPEDDALHLDIVNFKAFSSSKAGFAKRMGIVDGK